MSRVPTGHCDPNLLPTISLTLLSIPKYGQITLGQSLTVDLCTCFYPEGFANLFTQQNSIYVSKFSSAITVLGFFVAE